MLVSDASVSNGWTAAQTELVEAVLSAHAASATRENISFQALKLAAIGSGSYFQAISAALATLGGIHAPLTQTYDLLWRADTVTVAQGLLEAKQMIPGWGNGFVKGAPDPIWQPVESQVREQAPDLMVRVDGVTALFAAKGKTVLPNPSCWTASAGLILGLDRQTVGYLFLEGRLAAWTEALRRFWDG